jgi:hypothetical protein
MKKIFLLLLIVIAYQTTTAQNVGIGTTTPNFDALLDLSSTTKGVLFPRMTTVQRINIPTPPNGLMVFDTDRNELYQYISSTFSWKALISDSYWRRQSLTRNRIGNSSDSVGIGLLAPTEWLDVDGNIRSRNDLLADGRVVATGTVSGSGLITQGGLTVSANGLIGGNFTANGDLSTNSDLIINNAGATLQLKNGSNVSKGFFQIAGDDVRFGTNSGNNLGNVIVRMNGNNRFTFTDEGRLTLSADNTPTINFNSGGIPQASLQVQGNDLSINAPNNKVRISNVIYADDATNRVGIGTISPTERLHVSGNTYISGSLTSNGRSYFNQTINVADTLYAPGGVWGDFVKVNRGSFGGINTRATGGYLAVGYDVLANGEGSCIIADASAGFLNNTANKMLMRFENGYRLLTENDLSSGVFMGNGDNSWSSISDSTKKENFKYPDGAEFLKKIGQMKLGSWNYKTQHTTKRHYGPMAQEFYSNFGNDGIGKIGTDTAIATADIDGVMMIALQALEKRTTGQQQDIIILNKEVADLRAIIVEQKKLLDAIISQKNKQ